MVIKYKNKLYNSEDLPILLYFKSYIRKKEFINELSNYAVTSGFAKINSIDVVLAGNTVIKDKRSATYFCLESIEEKKSLQKQIFNTPEDNNAIISTPGDINLEILEKWIVKNSSHLL